MARRDTTPKQTALRRYIIGKMFPECKDEPLPLGEVALAKKFGTTRLTVQRACQDLIDDHSLIRIPGRRGLFINPDYARMRGERRFFGIVSLPHTESIFEIQTFSLVTGFSEAMQDINGDFQFISLFAKDSEGMAQELLSYPISGIVWIAPQQEAIDAFEKVVEAGRPAVALMPAWRQFPHPASNTILPDYRGIGVIRAETVLASGVSKPGYFAISKWGAYIYFCRYLKQRKLIFDESNFVKESKGFMARLAKLIEHGLIDSLVADGRIYPYIRDICREIPNIPKIKLFLDDNPRSRHIAKEIPELDITFFPFYYQEHHLEIGRLGGKLLRKILEQGGTFENQIAQHHEFCDSKPTKQET